MTGLFHDGMPSGVLGLAAFACGWAALVGAALWIVVRSTRGHPRAARSHPRRDRSSHDA